MRSPQTVTDSAAAHKRQLSSRNKVWVTLGGVTFSKMPPKRSVGMIVFLQRTIGKRRRTSNAHAVRSVWLAAEELVPYFPHIMKGTPWRSQESPPANTCHTHLPDCSYQTLPELGAGLLAALLHLPVFRRLMHINWRKSEHVILVTQAPSRGACQNNPNDDRPPGRYGMM